MPLRVVQPPPHIFDDATRSPTKSTPAAAHKRTSSVGDVLRGHRLRENTSTTPRAHSPTARLGQSPLGERHVNSPPQSRKIPTKGDEARSQMHKRTNSSVSIKNFMRGKDLKEENVNISSLERGDGNPKPKKIKSSNNLAGLLRKKSKRDLNEDISVQRPDRESHIPTSAGEVAYTPIWAQFATQPVEGVGGGILYPPSKSGIIEDDIELCTPRDHSKFRHPQQRSVHDNNVPELAQPPQRPFLEHKSSRSSIFKENMDENDALHTSRGKAKASSSPLKASDLQSSHQRPSGNHPGEETKSKRSSRVLDAISTFSLRSRKEACLAMKNQGSPEQELSPQDLDSAFERVLDSLNIPHNMRDNMRNLKPDVKVGLMKGERIGSGSSTSSIGQELRATSVRARERDDGGRERPKSQGTDTKEEKRSRSRSRPRSRILTMSKRDAGSPSKSDNPTESKRSRSRSRPKSIDITNRPLSSKGMASNTSLVTLATPDCATLPGDFIHYLREVQKPSLVEVGKLHKLRILLRNESVSWTDTYVSKGGMNELVELLYRIIRVEWREDHEDALLHETLLCLKALCTTSLALEKLKSIADTLFPTLLAMLFDEEKKGPSEFSTRNIVISLLFAHLSDAQSGKLELLHHRAEAILGYLKDPALEDKRPLDFIAQMYTPRPYRVWCKEVVNVTKEVFWIFLHNMNVIPIVEIGQVSETSPFSRLHFPAPRPPHPAAPYVGGVEWEATQYLATQLDLLNGLIASLPSQQERNNLREDLRQSGWEKAMGGTMRTCKEKFYGGVHEGLKVWVAAARVDGWPVEDVRAGPPRETTSPRKSPVKKSDEAPKIGFDVAAGQLPKLDDGWV